MYLLALLLIAGNLPSQIPPPEANVLVYQENVQISAEIDEYDNLRAGLPLSGSIMVTHDANVPVDQNSFMIGDKSLEVTFVQNVLMSSMSNLQVTIYHFQLGGLSVGQHTLPIIKVKVGGAYYAAPPIILQIYPS